MPAIFAASIGALAVDIGLKWALIGNRRKIVGSGEELSWDKSSYNQRWILHKTVQSLRIGLGGRSVLDFIVGSGRLVMYFRCLGARLGRNVCLYPNSGDPMMTEPDLVTMEHDSAADNASLVCHINTKGKFKLNHLRVGQRAVLRTNTRLMSGATMQQDSTLLEHTLVPEGDIVYAGTEWQGWPGAPCSKKAD